MDYSTMLLQIRPIYLAFYQNQSLEQAHNTFISLSIDKEIKHSKPEKVTQKKLMWEDDSIYFDLNSFSPLKIRLIYYTEDNKEEIIAFKLMSLIKLQNEDEQIISCEFKKREERIANFIFEISFVNKKKDYSETDKESLIDMFQTYISPKTSDFLKGQAKYGIITLVCNMLGLNSTIITWITVLFQIIDEMIDIKRYPIKIMNYIRNYFTQRDINL